VFHFNLQMPCRLLQQKGCALGTAGDLMRKPTGIALCAEKFSSATVNLSGTERM